MQISSENYQGLDMSTYPEMSATIEKADPLDRFLSYARNAEWFRIWQIKLKRYCTSN